MAILINLLPEVRQAKIKAKRQRHLTIAVAFAVCAVSLAAVAILAVITGGQALVIGQIQKDINNTQTEIQKDPDLPRILTVQSHLGSLSQLYDNRVYMTALFDLLPSVTPTDFAMSSFSIDAGGIITVSGQAKNISLVDKFVKALEASKSSQAHFSNVTITSVNSGSDKKASFTASFQLNSGVTNAKR